MKSLCANYGLAAALILTMTFANYAAIGSDAWINYVGVWMTSDECQELARASCNSTIQVTSQTKLGGVGLSKQSWTQGAEFYCTDVYREWTKDGGNPYMSIQGTDKECCSQTIRCGLLSAWNLELAFIIGNGGDDLWKLGLRCDGILGFVQKIGDRHVRRDERLGIIFLGSSRRGFLPLFFLLWLFIGLRKRRCSGYCGE